MASITLNDINVYYPVQNDHYMSIRRAALRALTGGRMYREDAQGRNFHALKNISFELHDGDSLALIGRNGAGKSTLLRTLGGFITPSQGHMAVDGQITSIFSVNGGMDIERTGYQNIYFVGRLLGLSQKEMESHIKEIEEFSELGNFLNSPIRTYSDGMKIRLGFAIVTCLKPEILILDEAIGAGDAHFIEKATKRAHALYERARILVMASHDPHILRNLCNKAMWLEHGAIKMSGKVEEVLEAYMSDRS